MARITYIVLGSLMVAGCGDSGDDTRGNSDVSNVVTTVPMTTGAPTTEAPPTTSDGTSATPTEGTAAATGESTAGLETTDASATDETGIGCGLCDQPNQQCIDDVCVTGCQGQDPDPCGPAQVCDVISGECKDPGDGCVLGGPPVLCGASSCGAGTVCDGVDTCVPVAPCGGVKCSAGGDCWGTQCACERPAGCTDPALDLLNGPFGVDIGGLDFADDCTAWMVTLRGGTDYLRRLTPAGEVTEWAGVANLNMGEVKVLRSLSIPQLKLPPQVGAHPVPPTPKEGLGEVAITYTCCPECGCFVDPPQGVARLVEESPDEPLPIVIVAMPTKGVGPFDNVAADAGPQGLTWGVDRVLYVGNSTSNGDFNSADLDTVMQSVESKFATRVLAAAPVSAAHLVVGLTSGEVHRYNVVTKKAELLLKLAAAPTGFTHDNFTGQIYASLANLDIVVFDPFTAELAVFGKMPGKGRVTFSPSGTLYFTPVKYVQPGTISTYPLPNTF